MLSNKNPLAEVVRGAAFATVAAVLTPVNVILVQREMWTVLYVVVAVQVVSLALAGVTLWRSRQK